MPTTKTSLKNKISLSILSLIIFFGALATGVTFYLTSSTLATNMRANIAVTSDAHAQKIYEIMRLSRDISKIISSRQEVVNFLSNYSPKAPKTEILSLLNGYNLGDIYGTIYLIDQTGLTLVSTNPILEDQNFNFRPYVQHALKGESYVDVSLGVITNELGYYFSSPVIKNGEVIGVAVVKLKSTYLNTALNLNSDSSYEISIIDQYGVVVGTSDQAKLYHSLAPLSPEVSDIFGKTRRFASQSIDPLTYDQIMHNLSNITSDPYVISLEDKHDEANEIISVAKIEDFPFYIFYEGETELATRSSLQSALTIAGFVFIAAITASFAISMIVSRFLSPLIQLQAISQSISQGDYDVDITIDSDDEIGTFASTLKHMISSIKNQHQEIEAKVKTRTAELENLNKVMIGRELKMIELKKELEKLKNLKDPSNGS